LIGKLLDVWTENESHGSRYLVFFMKYPSRFLIDYCRPGEHESRYYLVQIGIAGIIGVDVFPCNSKKKQKKFTAGLYGMAGIHFPGKNSIYYGIDYLDGVYSEATQ